MRPFMYLKAFVERYKEHPDELLIVIAKKLLGKYYSSVVQTYINIISFFSFILKPIKFLFSNPLMNILLLLTLSLLATPLITNKVFEFFNWCQMNYHFSIGTYDFSTTGPSITAYEATNLVLLAINTIAIAAFSFLSYKINKEQFDLINKINGSNSLIYSMNHIFLRYHTASKSLFGDPLKYREATNKEFNPDDDDPQWKDDEIVDILKNKKVEYLNTKGDGTISVIAPILFFNDSPNTIIINKISLTLYNPFTKAHNDESICTETYDENDKIDLYGGIKNSTPFNFIVLEGHKALVKQFCFKAFENVIPQKPDLVQFVLRVETTNTVVSFDGLFNHCDLEHNIYKFIEKNKGWITDKIFLSQLKRTDMSYAIGGFSGFWDNAMKFGLLDLPESSLENVIKTDVRIFNNTGYSRFKK